MISHIIVTDTYRQGLEWCRQNGVDWRHTIIVNSEDDRTAQARIGSVARAHNPHAPTLVLLSQPALGLTNLLKMKGYLNRDGNLAVREPAQSTEES